MNFSSTLSKFLSNKTARIVVIVFAILNVIGYLVMGNYKYVIYFGIISLIVRYFSKNMIVILGIPLIIVNLLSSGNLKEGLNNKEKEKDDQEKIDKLLEKSKQQNHVVIFPLNDANAEANADADIENFQEMGINAGATMADAYHKDYGFSREKEMKIQNQMQVMEDAKRMSKIVEKFTSMGKKMKDITPYQM
jgi:hypothetical protein